MGKELDPKKNRFGPYALVEELAVGGMAEVFLANHHALDGVLRKVVVKRMLDQFSDDDEFRSMFLHEARLMAALTHPNIAQIYDVGRDHQGRLFLVMEYIRGPNLRDLMYRAERSKARKVPIRFGLSVAIAVAEALHYVHTRRDPKGQPLGIVHRDLNPANVMVTHDGAVKLIDFGIAKAASSMVQTAIGIVKGTRGYMAPEQITAKRVDHRADVFNLGVILYELLLGRHPFESENRGAQLLKVVEGRWTPPAVHDPEFPQSLATLLSQCLAADRDHRLDSVEKLIELLSSHQRENGLSATLSEIGAVVSQLTPSVQDAASLHRQVELTPVQPVEIESSVDGQASSDIMESTDPTLIQPVLDSVGVVGTTAVTRLAHSVSNKAMPSAERHTKEEEPETIVFDGLDDEDELPTVSIENIQGRAAPKAVQEDEEREVEAGVQTQGKDDSEAEKAGVEANENAVIAERITQNMDALPHSRANRIGHRLVMVLGIAVVALSIYLAMLLNE